LTTDCTDSTDCFTAIAIRVIRAIRGESVPMKKPTTDERKRMCTGKRRYRTQGDALDAALVAGVERQRSAYRCTLCGQWHLTSR
jgi:hypothetical protein